MLKQGDNINNLNKFYRWNETAEKVKQNQRIKVEAKKNIKANYFFDYKNWFVFLHKNSEKKVWFIMSAQPSPACMTPQSEQEKVSGLKN